MSDEVLIQKMAPIPSEETTTTTTTETTQMPKPAPTTITAELEEILTKKELTPPPSEESVDANNNDTSKRIVYSVSEEYWAKQPATVNGMLGGYEYVSEPDIAQSQEFLNYFLKYTSVHKFDTSLCLDCGAGIGRVSKNLLLKNFDRVEMTDVTENFISKATDYMGADLVSRVAEFHCCGLQSFIPLPFKYDCIWMQWVLGYLSDRDLVDFFKRCKTGLKPNGMCILKENVTQEVNEFDDVDSSFTRPRKAYIDLIHKAGMRVIKDERQKKFPAELYEVRIIAFK